jgi:uncharacterized membrane protein YphA (DoxX/SURF4 family)
MLQASPLNFRRIIMWLGRIVIAVIFIYAGLAKLIRWDLHLPHMSFPFPWKDTIPTSLFAAQIDSYQMVPPWASLFIAHWLPWAEILVGVLLLIGWRLHIWATFVTLIIGGFFVAVLRAYALGLDINCGCFAKPEPLTWVTVLRDGSLFLLALLMTVFAFLEARKPHPWSAAETPSA